MLEEVAACGATAPRLCVSLAAGIPLRNLRAWLGPEVHWARAMPSPACRIGRGLTPVSFDRSVSQGERVRVRRFFKHVGPVLDLSEKELDAMTAAHSPTHGYHALAALAKAAQARRARSRHRADRGRTCAGRWHLLLEREWADVWKIFWGKRRRRAELLRRRWRRWMRPGTRER